MMIKRIELQNIKSYKNETIDFRSGINAIRGENFAGKSTIIQAIGFALFDHLSIKPTSKFIRGGERKGSIEIEFEGKDERNYIVIRNIGTSQNYYAFDPLTNKSIVTGKADTCRWLQEIMGIEQGTKLKELFEEVIGVGQGLMIPPFLLPPSNRKKIFDSILKVDEYENVFTNSREILSKIKNDIGKMKEEIKELKGRTIDYDELKEENKSISKDIENISAKLKDLNKEFDQAEKKKTKLEKLSESLSKFENMYETLKIKKQSIISQIEEADDFLHASKEAKRIVINSKRSAKTYERNEKVKEQLDKKKDKKDSLEIEYNKVDKRLIKLSTELKEIKNNLKNIRKSETSLERINPMAIKQIEFETEIEKKKDELNNLRIIESEINGDKKRVLKLRNEKKELSDKLRKYKEHKRIADLSPGLEENERKIRDQISKTESEQNKYKNFSETTSGGLCPFFSSDCPRLKSGSDLNDYFSKRISDLKSNLSEQSEELRTVENKVIEAKNAEKLIIGLEHKQNRVNEINEILNELNKRIKRDSKKVAKVPEIEIEIKTITKKIKKLNDPKSKLGYHQKIISHKKEFEENLRTKTSDLEENMKIWSSIKKELSFYRGIEKKITSLKNKLESLKPDYIKYHKNLNEANELGKREKTRKYLEGGLNKNNKQIKVIRERTENIREQFDNDEFERIKNEYDALSGNITEKKTIKNTREERLKDVDKKISSIESLLEKMKKREGEKESLEKTKELFVDIRTLLKHAGPIITMAYLKGISMEAESIFRQLIGEPKHLLRWSRDYDIILQTGKEEKSFNQLSGSEQVTAALAIRLALIKQLAGVNIAFFDEPTNNLDEERRANLASTIPNIKGFEQLFVISHDEAFDHVIENIIHIQNVKGESKYIK